MLYWAAQEMFQLTAARRRLGILSGRIKMPMMFQLTAARRRLVVHRRHFGGIQAVSTHSRPKAAGYSAAIR